MERQQPLHFPRHPYDVPASHLNEEFFDMLEEIGRTSYIDSLESLTSNHLKDRPPIDRARFQRIFQAIAEKNYIAISQYDFHYIRSVFDDEYIKTFKQVCQAYDSKQPDTRQLAYVADKYQKTLVTLIDHLCFLGQLEVIHHTFSTQTELHNILADQQIADATQHLLRNLPEIGFGNHFTHQGTQYMFVIKHGNWGLYDVTHQSILTTREQHIVNRFSPPGQQFFLVDCPRHFTPEAIHDRILSFITTYPNESNLEIFLTHILHNPKDIVQTLDFINHFIHLRSPQSSESAFIKNVCSEQYRSAFSYKLADIFREQKIYQAQQTIMQLSSGKLKSVAHKSYDQILTEPRYTQIDNKQLTTFIAEINNKCYLITSSPPQLQAKLLTDAELATLYHDPTSGWEFC